VVALPDHALLKRLLASSDDTRAHKVLAQVRENDDMERPNDWAGRRWPPGCDQIRLGQLPPPHPAVGWQPELPRPPQPAALLSRALRFQLTRDDAAYLELALRLQLPIATRDDALADAAWAAGVGVLTA